VRAILVVNQTATRTTTRTRDVLVHALSADLDVDVVETTHRGHAHELARRAVTEHRESLRPLLAALPARERTSWVLRFFRGMTQSQIAAQLGISQMHVSRLLARTLTQLREGLLVEE
jgi:RNA polymerase sigma factor (sigma-70 family)